jgi:hypothetical protein
MPSERREPSQPQMNKIDVLITEAMSYLSQYMGGMERFEQRYEAATDLLQNADDIKAPDAVFRYFSDYSPL